MLLPNGATFVAMFAGREVIRSLQHIVRLASPYFPMTTPWWGSFIRRDDGGQVDGRELNVAAIPLARGRQWCWLKPGG
jgi:hypothetical protein